jgi:hypothetical protein
MNSFIMSLQGESSDPLKYESSGMETGAVGGIGRKAKASFTKH